jgi:hypothetical protein
MNKDKFIAFIIWGPILVLVAFLLLGGNIRLNMAKDEKLVRTIFLENDFIKEHYNYIVEVNPLPNGFSKGYENAPRWWRQYKVGSETPGYFTYEVKGELKGVSGRIWNLKHKVYYKRISESQVEITKIDFSPL